MNTATVATLTAEVRVLVVNNRQVTAGVVMQLDTVDWTDLEPMGRVLVRCDRGPECASVMGASRGSEAPSPPVVDRPGSTVPMVTGRHISWCVEEKRSGRSHYVLKHFDQVFEVPVEEIVWGDCLHSPGQSHGWQTSDTEADWERAIHHAKVHLEEEHARLEQWRNMPLVILASMR